MGKPKPRRESSKSPNSSGKLSGGLKPPDGNLDANQILNRVLAAVEGLPPSPKEEKEVEGWLDWGLGLLKEAGPLALELAPALLALL